MASVDKRVIAGLADQLYQAGQLKVSIDPISLDNPGLTIEDAYAIQLRNIARELDQGARVSGKKIGLTSEAMQSLLGVSEPDYGHLLDNMQVTAGVIDVSTMLQPRVEAEIAFVLSDNLVGPGLTVVDVLAATDYVVASLEIVDSRIRDWQIKLLDTVADNASSGRYVLGNVKIKPNQIDMIAEQMTLYKNGEVVGTGSGSAVLGDPAYCVAWLANKLSDFGVTLNRGEVVLSGALSAMVEAFSGDSFRADFFRLGSVSVSFI